MSTRLKVAFAFILGAAVAMAAIATAASGAKIVYLTGLLDTAKAPTVGVTCTVGRTPSPYHSTLQSRFSLYCYQELGKVSPLVVFFSDGGVVVQRGAPTFKPLYLRTNP